MKQSLSLSQSQKSQSQSQKALFTPEKLVIMAGPCMLESEQIAESVLVPLQNLCKSLGMVYVFKSSFDKANRTSGTSVRGPGIENGLKTLAMLKERHGVPVITDIHSPEQAKAAAAVSDIIQIPAFLCEDRELLRASAKTGCILQIKKGQYIAPERLASIAAYLKGFKECGPLAFCERGTSFGYHNLVVDFKHFDVMRALGHAVVFDATHSVQLPGAGAGVSSGKREHIATLARAAAATGLDGLFMEVHPDPQNALSDKDTQLTLEEASQILHDVAAIDACVRKLPTHKALHLPASQSQPLTP